MSFAALLCIHLLDVSSRSLDFIVTLIIPEASLTMESHSFGSWRTSKVPRSPSPSPSPLFVERDGFDSPGGLVVNFDFDESSSAGPDGEENDGATEQTWREA